MVISKNNINVEVTSKAQFSYAKQSIPVFSLMIDPDGSGVYKIYSDFSTFSEDDMIKMISELEKSAKFEALKTEVLIGINLDSPVSKGELNLESFSREELIDLIIKLMEYLKEKNYERN